MKQSGTYISLKKKKRSVVIRKESYMSKELTRAEELIKKVQNTPELLEKLPKMTKDEALEMAKELGYGEVTEAEIAEVLSNNKELSDEDLETVAGGNNDEMDALELMRMCLPSLPPGQK